MKWIYTASKAACFVCWFLAYGYLLVHELVIGANAATTTTTTTTNTLPRYSFLCCLVFSSWEFYYGFMVPAEHTRVKVFNMAYFGLDFLIAFVVVCKWEYELMLQWTFGLIVNVAIFTILAGPRRSSFVVKKHATIWLMMITLPLAELTGLQRTQWPFVLLASAGNLLGAGMLVKAPEFRDRGERWQFVLSFVLGEVFTVWWVCVWWRGMELE